MSTNTYHPRFNSGRWPRRKMMAGFISILLPFSMASTAQFPWIDGASALSTTEKERTLHQVQNIVHEKLPSSYKKQSLDISKAIFDCAIEHNIDPLLVTAIISHESRFRPQIRGRHGEIGLMQIKPSTAKWLWKREKKSALPKNFNLKSPVDNIQAGVMYLSYLQERLQSKVSREQLHIAILSTYNMGPDKWLRLVKAQKKPKIYSNKVLRIYQSYRKTARALSTEDLALSISSTEPKRNLQGPWTSWIF